jgi:cytochrome c553
MVRLLKVTLLMMGMILLFCAHGFAQQGKAIFEGKGNCWTCHGRDGRGTPLGPDLTAAAWLNTDGSVDSVRALIRAGVPRPKKYPAPMPAMGGARLSAAEINAVTEYVLSLRRTPPQAAATATTSWRAAPVGWYTASAERTYIVAEDGSCRQPGPGHEHGALGTRGRAHRRGRRGRGGARA